MSRYVLRRLLLLAPTLFLVTLLVFSIIRLLPGNIVVLMMSEQGYASDQAKLEQMLGLDHNVIFTGMAKVEEYLPNIDLLVLTSISEAQPKRHW